MSIFCFREALGYLGLQLRATFQKEIDKQEAEIKKKNERRSSESYHEVWQPSQESEEPKTISSKGWAVRNFQN